MAKYLDKETQSIAATVSDVLEGKAPKKEEKKDKKEAKKAVKEVEQPKAPDGKNGPQTGEVDFKAKHKVKKSGKKLDGSDVKEQVAFAFDTQKAARDFGNKVDGMPMNIVKVGSGKYYVVELRQDADKKAREKAAQIAVKIGLSESYLDEEEVEEKEVDELSDKQKKYQEFFQKALKRFKVDSPAELDKEGRKKFFDYVDKNYDAGDNETD